MSLRDNASYVFGPSIVKIIPKNTDGSTALPYPEKTEVAGFGGLGPFNFSGAEVTIGVIPMTVKLNNIAETKSLDLTAAVDSAAVTVDEMVTALTTAAFTGITASKDSRGYLKLLVSAGTPTSDYLQVFGQAAELSMFGNGYGLKFIIFDTQQTFTFSPTNVDDESIEVVDSNGLKTKIIKPGYRDGVIASMVDTAVDDAAKALITGGTYNPTTKEWVAPLSDAFRSLISVEVVNKMYLKDTNQDDDWIGVKQTRAYNMSAKEDSSGDGGRAFQTPNYSFTGTPYTDPTSKVKYGDSMTKDYSRAEYLLLDYENV